MAIEIRKGKKRTAYRVYWNNPVTGAREHKTFYDEFDARDFDTAQRRKLKNDPGAFATAEPDASPRFVSLARAYMSEKGLAPSTYTSTFLALTREIFPHIGHKEAAKLAKEDLKKCEAAWRAKGNKQITINRKISIIKAVLSWAEEEGKISAHPLPRYSCKRGPAEKFPPPTPSEVAKLYEAAPEHLRRVIILGSGLGVRVGSSELLRLRWRDVDFEAGIIRVWSALKNPERPWRDIHLTEHMKSCLGAWKAQDGPGEEFLVHYQGRAVGQIKTAWGSMLKKAGIARRIRPYDLRHYFATQAIGQGADTKAVADIMGHSTTRLTQDTYQHALSARRREAVGLVQVPGQNLGHFSGHSDGQNGIIHVPENDGPKQ